LIHFYKSVVHANWLSVKIMNLFENC